jgi:imidazolonepropionase-like amidohydrolase
LAPPMIFQLKRLTVPLLAVVAACATPQHPAAPAADRWLLTAKRVYVAPDAPPLDDAWVLIEHGTIAAVGNSTTARPGGARSSPECSGGVITAGFQNSHVHLVGPFDNAATRAPAELEQALSRMLTRFGVTTVVDTGSMVSNTVTLRQRIERGEVQGPAILTAGVPLYPQNGIPFYLRDLPAEILRQLPQPANSQDALGVIANTFAAGANGTKLFVATPQGNGEIKRMSPEIARAAAAETHRRGGLVMAHPTDAEGVGDAVAAGVDIVVHTTIDPSSSTWSNALFEDMVARHVSVVPTLKLWGYELDKGQASAEVRAGAFSAARAQVQAFANAGGQVLFGTDVGYMTDVDPTDEYVLMAAAGLTPMQILSSLTTAPAARWKEGARRGRVSAGLDADLVVLGADPFTDVRHFGSVQCTIRGGRKIFVNHAQR